MPIVNPRRYHFVLSVHGLTLDPADSTTYYFGSLLKTPGTAGGYCKVPIRRPGIIVAGHIYTFAGTAGTNENISMYIRLNDTTDYLIATVGLAAQERQFINNAMNIPVAAGNFFVIKMVCPAWATNPLTLCVGGYIYIAEQ